MKIIGLALVLFSAVFCFGQVSYDFKEALPSTEKSSISVSSSDFGIYLSENKEIQYEFNEKGISIITTIYSSISKETIRESSKYSIRNGYLFGLVEKDSLPCFLAEDNRYYFGLKSTEQLIGSTSQNSLKKISSTSYLINYYENGGFTPSLLTFSKKEFSIQYFDYETNTTQFSTIVNQTDKQIVGMKYVTLLPTKKEWKELDQSKLFGNKILYSKIK